MPALLYVVYNNLTFLNIQQHKPAVYASLMNIRILITGIYPYLALKNLNPDHVSHSALLSKLLINRQISRCQWISLFMLTVGCAVTQTTDSDAFAIDALSVAFILLQASLSSLAGFRPILCRPDSHLKMVDDGCSGVYSEMVFKEQQLGIPDSIHWSNLVLYTQSALFNALVTHFAPGEQVLNPCPPSAGAAAPSVGRSLTALLRAAVFVAGVRRLEAKGHRRPHGPGRPHRLPGRQRGRGGERVSE